MEQSEIRLVEVFKDWTPQVVSKVKGNVYRYMLYKIRGHKKVTPRKLKKYVEYLKKKNPSEPFALKRVVIGKKPLFVITKDGVGTLPCVEIFIDTKRQRFYVKKEDVENNERLTSYVVMRCLGSLQVSQSRYAGAGGLTHESD